MWVAEAWGQDAVSVLGHLSAVTERVALGSGLMQIPGRTPAMTAMTAATLDVLSGGRFRLGLGVSGPAGIRGLARRAVHARRWHGRASTWRSSGRRSRARGRSSTTARSSSCRSSGGSGLGKPLKLLARPVQERIPIYLGSMGPKAIEQTARIADGWLPSMFSARAGSSPSRAADVDISPVVMLCVDEDLDRARDLARPWLTVYLGGMGAKGKNFYVEAAERFGQGDAAREVQERFMAGDRAGAAMALTPELIDRSAICCRPAEIDERLAYYERAGATTLLAMPFGDRPAIVDRLAAAVAA